MADAVHALFEQFKAGGVALAERIIDERWHETLIIDFKTASSNSGPMQADDHKNLGKALSGFGNSDGGIVVWGVRADQQQSEEADVAKEPKPIRNLSIFLSDLFGKSSQFVSPPIIGVDHCAVYSDRDRDIGYAVSYVPRIEGDPAMNMVKGEHRYYCRIGSSFVVMEGYMLSDRFHRLDRPKLEIVSRIMNRGRAAPRTARVDIIVGIQNTSSAAARYPSLRLILPPHCALSAVGLDEYGQSGLPKQVTAPDKQHSLREHLFGGGADYVVYPQSSREVARLSTSISMDSLEVEDLVIKYEIYALGSSAVGEITIAGSDILECMRVQPTV